MVRRVTYTASLLDLMQGYARVRTRDEFRPFVMDRENVFTLEEALDKMRHLIRFAGEWTDLAVIFPKNGALIQCADAPQPPPILQPPLNLQNPVMLNYDSLSTLGVLN